MIYKNILIENKEKICYITINRTKQLNALNTATITELNQAINQAENDKLIRCIILTGSGVKAFVAGADINEFANFNKNEGENLAKTGQELLLDLLRLIYFKRLSPFLSQDIVILHKLRKALLIPFSFI